MPPIHWQSLAYPAKSSSRVTCLVKSVKSVLFAWSQNSRSFPLCYLRGIHRIHRSPRIQLFVERSAFPCTAAQWGQRCVWSLSTPQLPAQSLQTTEEVSASPLWRGSWASRWDVGCSPLLGTVSNDNSSFLKPVHSECTCISAQPTFWGSLGNALQISSLASIWCQPHSYQLPTVCNETHWATFFSCFWQSEVHKKQFNSWTRLSWFISSWGLSTESSCSKALFKTVSSVGH